MIENNQGERYRLLGTLGSGAAADMFLAEDLVEQRCCALKRFDRTHSSVAFALKEAAIIQGIRHPHVVQCIDFFFRGTKELFLVYEYMDGGSLRDLIRAKKKFTLDEASTCICHILSGVAVLHRLQVVHCDLKPENILVQFIDGCPVYKVGDFDVAVFVKELAGSDITIEGSPAYMAPERFGDSFSFQSDLYSVGVIFYELLAGERPFKGNTLQIMQGHQTQEADFSLIEDKATKTIIASLLSKDPKQRNASAKGVLQMLERNHSERMKTSETSGQEPPTSRKSSRLSSVKGLAMTAEQTLREPLHHGRKRELSYPLYGPASSDSLEELSEFTIPRQADWVYVVQCEDEPYLGLVHGYKLDIYDGIRGKPKHTDKNWVNVEVQPLNPYTFAYRNQYSICCLNLITMEERVLLSNLNNATGFTCHSAGEELVWTNSHLGNYVRLNGEYAYSFPCMNFGVVPRIRFLANSGLLYSTGPVAPALNIVDKYGMLIDKLLLDSPVISATEGFDRLFFVTLSQGDKDAYKLYFYDENRGVDMALLTEEIQAYTTFGHYFIALLKDGKVRTYTNPTQYIEIRFNGPKNQAVFSSADNRFIFLLRRESERWIIRGYRNHEQAN